MTLFFYPGADGHRIEKGRRPKGRRSLKNRCKDSRSKGWDGSHTPLRATRQSRALTEGVRQAAPKGCPTAHEPHFVWPGIALLPIHSPAQPCVIASDSTNSGEGDSRQPNSNLPFLLLAILRYKCATQEKLLDGRLLVKR